MTSPTPHYLLFCDGNLLALGEGPGAQRGRWRFVLEDLASGEKIEATDQEVGCAPDRSALIAVLRGLEALEQPSRVTLVTTSRYVTRGLQYGLSEWRENDYSWEHFGAVQPIRNADIWKRIDRALAFHQVQCRWMAQEIGADGREESAEEVESSNGLPTQQAPGSAVPAAAVATKQQTHRATQSKGGTRTVVSASKYQRVYVDTPKSDSATSELGRTGLQSAASSVDAEEIASTEQAKQRRAKPVQKKIPQKSGWLAQPFLFLIRMTFRGPVWLCRQTWVAILAIDEWLESFLRCLFLLDPSKRPSRH